jgi:hypothetical protein
LPKLLAPTLLFAPLYSYSYFPSYNPSPSHEMASFQQQKQQKEEQQKLTQLHYKAVSQLHHKLSRIPERVFPSGRKPTISEIYTNNAEAVHIAGIPEHLQLAFVFEHYELFVAADFKVRKKEGDMNINMAIWYWQMDETHSLSRKHKQVRYNIMMACIIRASPELGSEVTQEARDFCDALINAWLWSVTRQDEYTMQARFLNIWANGSYDLMHFGRKARDAMDVAIRALEQYVPRMKPLVEDDISFWEGLRYTSPWKLKTYGPAWALQYIMEWEQAGYEILVKGKDAEAEAALASGSFMVSSICTPGVLRKVFGCFPAPDTLVKAFRVTYQPLARHAIIC